MRIDVRPSPSLVGQSGHRSNVPRPDLAHAARLGRLRCSRRRDYTQHPCPGGNNTPQNQARHAVGSVVPASTRQFSGEKSFAQSIGCGGESQQGDPGQTPITWTAAQGSQVVPSAPQRAVGQNAHCVLGSVVVVGGVIDAA